MNCDNCNNFEWYYDWCRKWGCNVDWREVHNCCDPIETPIRNAMVNGVKIREENGLENLRNKYSVEKTFF